MAITPQANMALKVGLENLANAVPASDKDGARDWQGFFSALAQLFVTIAPVVIPLLFVKQQPTP